MTRAKVSTEVRVKARVVGAAISLLGLAVLLVTGREAFSGLLSLTHTVGVSAAVVAAGIVLIGLVIYDLGRTRWALPIVQLGSVVALLAFLPLVATALLGVRSSADEMAPAFLFAGITASLCVFLMVLAGQTRADARRAGLD